MRSSESRGQGAALGGITSIPKYNSAIGGSSILGAGASIMGGGSSSQSVPPVGGSYKYSGGISSGIGG
jgi:hypothetical protein